jgi:hypothetical protein
MASKEEEGKRKVGSKNGATGRSDIEGKAVRVTASDIGDERVSIKEEIASALPADLDALPRQGES